MQRFGLNAGLETAVGQLVFEVVIFGQQFFDAVNEQRLGADDQDFVPSFFFQRTSRSERSLASIS